MRFGEDKVSWLQAGGQGRARTERLSCWRAPPLRSHCHRPHRGHPAVVLRDLPWADSFLHTKRWPGCHMSRAGVVA